MSKKHYINNGDFLVALVDYHDRCAKAKELNKEDPPIPNYVGECFLKIAEHLSRKPNFVSYSFRDEMICDGIENCIQYLRRIQKEKKQLYVKYKATQQFGLLNEGEMYEDEHGKMQQFQMYDNIAEFIETYEKTKDAKKKVKAKGLELFVEEEINEDDEK